MTGTHYQKHSAKFMQTKTLEYAYTTIIKQLLKMEPSDVFPSVFGGSIVTIKMGMEHTLSSRRFDLFGPSSVTKTLEYVYTTTAVL